MQSIGVAWTLHFDLSGRLWWLTNGANVTRFDYRGSVLLTETDGAGTVLRRYVPGPDEPILWREGRGLSDKRFLTTGQYGSVPVCGASLPRCSAIDVTSIE